MQQTGKPSSFGLENHGLENLVGAHWNLSIPALYGHSLSRGESELAAGGGFTDNSGPGVSVASSSGSVTSTDCDRGSVGKNDNIDGDVTGAFSHDVDGIGSFTCTSSSCL